MLADEQLRRGAFLVYLLFGIYAFTLLTIVCNDYFLPCVELICEDLKIPQVFLFILANDIIIIYNLIC